MKKGRGQKNRNDYKVIIPELMMDPFHAIKTAFALMGVIPLLILFYIIIGEDFISSLLLGYKGILAWVAVFISIIGFLYAYKLIADMIKKLLSYSYERKRADDAKSAFVANVTHEFQNPLLAVRESLSALLEGYVGEIDLEQKKIVEPAKRNIERLMRLVTDLLDLSKIEAGKMKMRVEKFDIVQLVNEILATYKSEVSKKQIFLKKDIPQDIGFLWADKDKLSEVIINLFSNAIKYTPNSGTITIKILGTSEGIRYEISDTGSGILRDDYERIFDKFERITAEKKEGTGLGLPIAKEIIALHKGKIWVESEIGKGSKFIFVMPRELRLDEAGR